MTHSVFPLSIGKFRLLLKNLAIFGLAPRDFHLTGPASLREGAAISQLFLVLQEFPPSRCHIGMNTTGELDHNPRTLDEPQDNFSKK
jgi:hypothetical protein